MGSVTECRMKEQEIENKVKLVLKTVYHKLKKDYDVTWIGSISCGGYKILYKGYIIYLNYDITYEKDTYAIPVKLTGKYRIYFRGSDYHRTFIRSDKDGNVDISKVYEIFKDAINPKFIKAKRVKENIEKQEKLLEVVQSYKEKLKITNNFVKEYHNGNLFLQTTIKDEQTLKNIIKIHIYYGLLKSDKYPKEDIEMMKKKGLSMEAILSLMDL